MVVKITTTVLLSRRNGNDLMTIIIKRALRAYIFGHVTDTGPRLLKILLQFFRGRLNIRLFVQQVIQVLRSSSAIAKFPAFCAILAGSYTFLESVSLAVVQNLIRSLLQRQVLTHVPEKTRVLRFCRVTAGLAASSFSFRLLNSPSSSRHERDKSLQQQNAKKEVIKDPSTAGRTLDLTILVAVRAIEALVGELWKRYRQPKTTHSLRASIENAVSRLVDPAVFAASAGIVMWAWIYNPRRLPPAYRKWIFQAASVDERLVQTLRNARNGEFVYGKDTGQAPLLQGMCQDYNWPLIWGDPAKTIPLPCEVVHMGVGNSCHAHALSRFLRAFHFSLAMYLPLQLAVKMRRPSSKAFVTSIQEAARSSAFLGAFISLFYYSICLSRTVLGPKLFRNVTSQMWDSGLCVGAGCAACGLSILLEKPQRQPELAFFVAPRAAGVFLPRRYDRKYLWREQIAFAMSAATLLVMVEENPKSARGLVGLVLSKILQ